MRIINLKKYLIKKYPKLFFFFKELYLLQKNSKVLYNIYNTNHKKTVLLSYITSPFYSSNKRVHTNHIEANIIGEILSELGYNIDVTPFTNKLFVFNKNYECVIGFGFPLTEVFKSNMTSTKTILYGTGMHIFHQNHISMKRLNDFKKKHNSYYYKGLRTVEDSWPSQYTLVDCVIALGDKFSKNSYCKTISEKKVFNVYPPYYPVQKVNEIIESRNISIAKNNFLWLGGSGEIHKGLDLLIEYFMINPHLNLTICGDVNIDFIKHYEPDIKFLDNIIFEGFVDISTVKFKNILLNNLFVIYPSCSEGGSPSVANAIGNGGLIPILSRESTVSTSFEIEIKELNEKGIREAIDLALALTKSEINILIQKNLDFIINNCGEGIYKTNMKKIISKYI